MQETECKVVIRDEPIGPQNKAKTIARPGTWHAECAACGWHATSGYQPWSRAEGRKALDLTVAEHRRMSRG